MIARVGLALGAGLLVALSLPPWGWWPLSFVGVAVFEVAIGAMPSRRLRLLAGAAFGLGWLATGTVWMWQLTAPGYVVASIVFATLHGFAAVAAPGGPWRVLGRPCAHTLIEALRFSFPFGGVPLASLGIAQAASPVAGVARVGGVIVITWVVLQVGVALGVLGGSVRRRPVATRPAEPARGSADVHWLTPALAGAGLVAAAIVFAVSFVAPRGSGTGEFLGVVAVQGGGEQGTSADDVPSSLVTARHLSATATIDAGGALDLVVWPENVVDVVDFQASEELQAVADEADRLGSPIAIGVTEDVDGQPNRFTNAQVIVTPDGEVTSRYDKVRRVPFGEYIPLRGLLEALGAPVDQVPNDAVAGAAPAVLDLPDGTRVGVVISWEVFFGGRARDGVRAGGEFILNPTNGASYSGTIVQTQQVASSRLRAIETGRWVVQAAPTGFSAFVTPAGDVLQRTAVGERAVISHQVERRQGLTWYTNLGDRPFIAAFLAALAVTWLATIRAHRHESRPPAPTKRSRW